MLPLKNRVKKEFFPEIMKNGRLLSSVNFTVRVLDRKDTKPTLFSFVVPNKVKKTSVGRHFIKRRMSASIEKVISKSKNGFSVIILAKRDLSGLSYSKLEKEILDLVGFLGYTH